MKTFNTLIAAIRLRAIESSVTRAGNVLSITVALCIVLALSTGIKSVSAQPTISSFEPISGPIGTSVTITGSNFNANPTANIVYFGAVRAEVTAASPTSLSVTVPIGVTYQPITVTTNSLTTYTAQPFILTFPGGGSAFTTSSFASHIDFSTGTSPFTCFTGDLDSDGKVDVVAGSYASKEVTIFKNTSSPGNISFAPIFALEVVASITSCTIGDIDGDGKLDIVVGNFNVNKVSVFRNTSTVGNISFATRQDFTTDQGPQYESIGDLDGDGKPEIVTSNYGSSNVSVLRNTSNPGSISFDLKIDFAIANRAFTNSIGDLDGDGKPEILAGTQTGTKFSILRNTSTAGTISFAATLDYETPYTPRGVSIGDLDGDGKSDIATANFTDYQGGSVSIFRNTSTSGSISFDAKVDYPTGGDGSDLSSISDLNGDGKPDIAVNNYWSGSVSVLKNTSNSGLISFQPYIQYSAGSGTHFVRCGDLDGDALPDMVVDNLFEGTISVLRNEIICIGFTVYADNDGDGYGDISNSIFAVDCITPDGYVYDSTDCNDANSEINPGACDAVNGNGFDDNCDGLIDDGFGTTNYYVDADGDGYGAGSELSLCENPGSGYSLNNTDCDDANSEINPGVSEVFNGLDDNCNGIIDDVVCNAPTYFEIKDLTATSVKFKWGYSAPSYKLRYKVATSGTWTLLGPTGQTKTVEGLVANTKYVWQIKSVCNADPKITSEWSPKQFFTTTPLRIGEEQVTAMEIYPNPASEKFILDLRLYSTTNQPASIYIMNTLGQVVYSSVETVGNGEMSEGLLTEKKVITMPSTVSSGWYVVRVVMSDQVIEKKLLYQK